MPPPPFLVDLAGEHRMRADDDLAFSSTNFDDSQWEVARIPGGYRAGGISVPDIRWYRITSHGPRIRRPKRSHCVWDTSAGLTRPSSTPPGRSTGWDSDFPDMTYMPRLYSLPDGAVHPGHNVLAIRTRGGPLAQTD